MNIRFNFKYSDTTRNAYFVKNGKELSPYTCIDYDTKGFSGTARESLLTIAPNLLSSSNPSFELGIKDTIPSIEEVQVQVLEMAVKVAEKNKAEAEKLRADTIAQTLIVEQIEALSEDLLPESLTASNLTSWQCVKSLRDRLATLEARKSEIVKARELSAKAAIKADRLGWINQHGSDRLKRAKTGVYNCQRLYIEERVALEFPEFDLDYSDDLSTKDRSCPSVNALNELDRYPQGRIVWVKLRHDRSDDDEYEYEDEDDYNGEEAIVIEDYLGSYTLVKYLGDPES
jgi:hypothetical protein